jgi:hypothetical protein
MQDTEYCPNYVDYVRECIFKINPGAEEMSFLAKEVDTTLRFCISGAYRDCPFFRFLNNPESSCEHFKNCPLCEYYKSKDLGDFVEMADKWCLNDFTSCARYKIREAGKIPEPTLHPAGHHVAE